MFLSIRKHIAISILLKQFTVVYFYSSAAAVNSRLLKRTLLSFNFILNKYCANAFLVFFWQTDRQISALFISVKLRWHDFECEIFAVLLNHK